MIPRENQEALITFIDYKAAFDTESQKFLDNALSSANVSPKVRRIIQSIFRVASGCVRIGNNTSKTFNISRGVLQGDIFSPVAFIAGLWKIFAAHDTLDDAGVTIGNLQTEYAYVLLSMQTMSDLLTTTLMWKLSVYQQYIVAQAMMHQ